jgi:hypothetical protein
MGSQRTTEMKGQESRMSSAYIAKRRPQPLQAQPQSSGNFALLGLKVVLMGCVLSLVGVLGHVAWKVVGA